MFELFEDKLGITLTSNDYEIINRLLDVYSKDQIKEALDIAYQNNAKKVQYVVRTLNNMEKENVPDWFYEKDTKEELTEEDKSEIEEAIECLKDFHPKDFKEWAAKQRAAIGL